MAAYIAIFLSLICITLLVYVLIRFKKLFSTEAIIEKTKVQMNKIIGDINKNANMDIDLINEATKRTRELMTAADTKMEELKEATSILRDMIAAVEKGSKFRADQSQIYVENSYGNEIKPMGQVNQSTPAGENSDKLVNQGYKKPNPIVNVGGYSSAAYRAKAYQATQYKDAFDDNDLIENKKEPESMQEPIATENVNMIPKIVTNIIPDDGSKSKKSLNEKVERLFRSGMQVDDIAIELSCSSSEVQFIIDMLVQPDDML